ncbi:hypothetical protein Tco_1519427, partial [Tanacetum coccineum]
MVRVNQIVAISLIESSIHILDQNRYPVDTSLIHLESHKSPTKSLFDVGSRRIFIVTVNTKEYHSGVLAIITRIMPRVSNISLVVRSEPERISDRLEDPVSHAPIAFNGQ